MSKPSAQLTQTECARFLKAAKEAGVPWVAVRLGNLPVVVPLNPQHEQCVELLRVLTLLTAEQCTDLLRTVRALEDSKEIVL
jgi:hypothetical protein